MTGNHTTPMDDAAALARAGVALYGDRWQTALARDLGVSSRAVRYWASGYEPISRARWMTIADLLERRAAECRAVADDIRAGNARKK